MKKLIIATALIFSNLSVAEVWQTNSQWNDNYKEDFKTWIKTNVDTDMFTSRTSPYYGIKVDCADVTYALKAVFGEKVNSIPMSSTKDRHGHAIASAGIQELGILCLAMENNCIPSNLNLKKSIRSEMDLVQNDNRKKDLRIGMTNNFAFGGVNSSLILKKT